LAISACEIYSAPLQMPYENPRGLFFQVHMQIHIRRRVDLAWFGCPAKLLWHLRIGMAHQTLRERGDNGASNKQMANIMTLAGTRLFVPQEVKEIGGRFTTLLQIAKTLTNTRRQNHSSNKI
jgi:hypothetical protein